MDLVLPGAREEECDSNSVGFGFWTAVVGVSWVSVLTVVDGEKVRAVRARSVDRVADETDEIGDEDEEGEELDRDEAERDADERDRAGVARTSGLVGVGE